MPLNTRYAQLQQQAQVENSFFGEQCPASLEARPRGQPGTRHPLAPAFTPLPLTQYYSGLVPGEVAKLKAPQKRRVTSCSRAHLSLRPSPYILSWQEMGLWAS